MLNHSYATYIFIIIINFDSSSVEVYTGKRTCYLIDIQFPISFRKLNEHYIYKCVAILNCFANIGRAGRLMRSIQMFVSCPLG